MKTTAPRTAPDPRRALALAALAALALLLAGPGRADAQFGFGGFGGFGWGFPYPYTPPSVNMLNERANVRAGMDQEALNRTSLSTPDRFDYRRQQVAMQQRFDVETMRGIDVDVRGRGTPIPGTRATPTDIAGAEAPVAAPPGGVPAGPAAARPMLSVASFVNDDGSVVWPSDAPVSGDLGGLRDRADASIKSVVQEEQAMDFARVDTVANARGSLLDYGRPALQFIRESSTPRVADTFHLFLLSLYDALAQSAERGVARQGTPSAPR